MPAEIWRPVVGYEGVYEVSSFGRVRRVLQGRGTRANKVLKPKDRGSGYYTISLSLRGVVAEFAIHYLVASAFLGPRPKGFEINHKDYTRKNNRVTNLEYVTKGQNLQHAYDNGRTRPYQLIKSVD